jgi:hypothetical protein
MGWPLNLSVIWRQAPRFFKGLTGYTYSEGTGPLEKSAALYQKDLGATTACVICLCWEPTPNRAERLGQRPPMPVTARRGIQLFFSADGFIPSMRWRSVPEKTKRG